MSTDIVNYDSERDANSLADALNNVFKERNIGFSYRQINVKPLNKRPTYKYKVFAYATLSSDEYKEVREIVDRRDDIRFR